MVAVTAVLHASLPPRWRPYSAPDLDLVARPPFDHGAFATTLLVARDELPAHVSMRAVLDATTSRLEVLGDEVEVLGERCVVTDGHERGTRLVAFDRHEIDERLVQVQCFVAPIRHSGVTRPVAQLVGTCTFDDLPRHGPAFADIAQSIRFA